MVKGIISKLLINASIAVSVPLNHPLLPKIVMISGAVSPAILATDSIIPVTIPPFAALNKILNDNCFGIPNACPASRMYLELILVLLL